MDINKSNKKKLIETVVRMSILGRILSDRSAVSILFKLRFGRSIDLDHPKTFNEKVLWLTLNDRKSIYTTMVDKYRAKGFIALRIGEGFTPKNIGKWEKSSQIPFGTLPPKYVLKCNHDSGSVVVCDRRKPTREELRRLDKAVKRNYYWFSREWPYKDVQPCIFAEEYIESPVVGQGGLVDYKVYCCNGIPYIICVISNRNIKPYLTFVNLRWEKICVRQRYDNHPVIPEKPRRYEEMLEIAKKLSQGIPFLRVDFFEDAFGKLYVGEMTFTPSSGLIAFEPSVLTH